MLHINFVMECTNDYVDWKMIWADFNTMSILFKFMKVTKPQNFTSNLSFQPFYNFTQFSCAKQCHFCCVQKSFSSSNDTLATNYSSSCQKWEWWWRCYIQWHVYETIEGDVAPNTLNWYGFLAFVVIWSRSFNIICSCTSLYLIDDDIWSLIGIRMLKYCLGPNMPSTQTCIFNWKQSFMSP